MTDDQINALTDPQINVMVQAAVTGASKYMSTTSLRTIFYEDGGVIAVGVKGYCNDAAVMIPLAFENGIGYVSGDGMVLAMKIHSAMENADGRIEINPDVKFIEYSDKVCRALAIVYLKSKGVL